MSFLDLEILQVGTIFTVSVFVFRVCALLLLDSTRVNTGNSWHTISLSFVDSGLEFQVDDEPAQTLMFLPADFGSYSHFYFGRRAAVMESFGVADRFSVSLLACVRKVSVAGADVNLREVMKQPRVTGGCHWTDSCSRRRPCQDLRNCVDIADTHLCTCQACIATRNQLVPGTTSRPVVTTESVSSRVRSISLPLQVEEHGWVPLTNYTLLLFADPPYSISLVTGLLSGPSLPPSGIGLRVTVDTQPLHGKIVMRGASSESPSLQDFSYHQLVRQHVGYQHDGSESTADTFSLSAFSTSSGDVLVSNKQIKVSFQKWQPTTSFCIA